MSRRQTHQSGSRGESQRSQGRGRESFESWDNPGGRPQYGQFYGDQSGGQQGWTSDDRYQQRFSQESGWGDRDRNYQRESGRYGSFDEDRQGSRNYPEYYQSQGDMTRGGPREDWDRGVTQGRGGRESSGRSYEGGGYGYGGYGNPGGYGGERMSGLGGYGGGSFGGGSDYSGNAGAGWTGRGGYGSGGPGSGEFRGGRSSWEGGSSSSDWGRGNPYAGGTESWQGSPEFGGQRSQGSMPKGYTRSDERIKDDVCERLYRCGCDVSEVSVEAKDGTVTLEGTVSDRRTKHRIEDIVEECIGVKDVDNKIRVSRQGGYQMGENEDRGSMAGSTQGDNSRRSSSGKSAH